MIFFWKTVPNWVHFGQGEDQVNHGTVRVQYPRNQAIKNGLNEVLLMSINEALFSRQNFVPFNSFCMKVIRTLNAQPVKIPHFKSLLSKQAR